MKCFITLIAIVLISCMAHAQNSIPEIDQSKCSGITKSSDMKTAEFMGFINAESADLVWKPNLINIKKAITHNAPNQSYLDSLNDAAIKIKSQYSSKKIAEKTTAVYPAIGSNFIGNSSDGMTPLDNSMAISNGGIIVSVTNRKIEYFNTSGTLLYWSPITSFLPSTFGVSDICDPVVIYDSGHDRFVFFCQDASLVSGSKIYVCYSLTNDPSAGWWCYRYNGDPTGGTDAFDYPKLAVNDSELFISGNLFYTSGTGGFHRSVVFQMNKLQGYAGASTINYVFYTNIVANPFTLLPVSWGQLGNIATSMLLVSTDNNGGDSIYMYRIDGNNCCSPYMRKYSTNTTPYLPPSDASQSGTTQTLKIRDCRALSGFYINDGTNAIIHFVFGSRNLTSSFNEINYNRLNITSMVNTSSAFGAPGLDYGFPAIASFATATTDKSVMIGFERSSASIYPEIRVVNCDNLMNWSASTLVKSGDSYVDYGYGSPDRWGDYTGMSRKHNSTTPSVWMSAGYGTSSNKWGTWIAEVHTGATFPTEIKQSGNVDAKVFPNPIMQNFSVQFTLEENTPTLEIAIVDITGRTAKQLYNGIAQAGKNVFSFDKANLPTGTYILTIKSATNVIKNENIVVN